MAPPQSERLWVIGGRPGNFKTQWTWNLALGMAERRQRVLWVGLEQTPQESALQALARYSRIPLDRIALAHNAESGVNLTDKESDALVEADRKVASLDLFVRFHGAATHGRSLPDVIRSATRARFDAVFVDHLGMIGRGTGERDLDSIPKAVDGLRALARGEVVQGYRPFVCVTSPLNRAIEQSEDERLPAMSDFRGSGLIESDADLAMVLRKRKREDESESPDTIDAFVLKNRQGRSPLVLQFEAQGAICLVTERRPDSPPPPTHWQEGEEP
jgi:replicative DNA helicase